MKPRRFWYSLLFAGIAALAAPVAGLALERWLDPGAARAFVVMGLVVAHGVAIAETARKRVGAGLLSGALSLGLLFLAGTFGEIVLGGAVIIGLCRTAYLYEAESAMRGLLTEGTLLCGGLLVGRLLAGPGPLAGAAAVWGFFLVQSTYFLVTRGAPRAADSGLGDPFERARSRLEDLLEDGLA